MLERWPPPHGFAQSRNICLIAAFCPSPPIVETKHFGSQMRRKAYLLGPFARYEHFFTRILPTGHLSSRLGGSKVRQHGGGLLQLVALPPPTGTKILDGHVRAPSTPGQLERAFEILAAMCSRYPRSKRRRRVSNNLKLQSQSRR
jgi:hypothetical protein